MTNDEYLSRIDKIAEKFTRDQVFFSKCWIERLTENGNELCIWGTGHFGMDCFYRFFRQISIEISYFCDSSPRKWGGTIAGSIPCIAPVELAKKENCNIIVAASGHEEEIYRQCVGLGIAPERIFYAPLSMFSWAANYLCSTSHDFLERMVRGMKELIGYFGEDERSKELALQIMCKRLINPMESVGQDGPQYFIPELPVRTDEAFVDAGAFHGDTLAEFVQQFPAGHSKARIHYYAFECENENVKAFQQNLENMDCEFPVELHSIALWDKAAELNFSAGGSSGALDGAGKEIVTADRLDDVLIGKRVSWIKMDIEGAEMQALAGCSSIVKKQKPRLSICVYHKATDLYEIPRYIKSLRDDYQMLLRHHSALDYETVLYAY